MSYYVLKHSAKGTTWGEHKYIRKEGNRYIYPEDIKNTVSNNASDNSDKSSKIDDYLKTLPESSFKTNYEKGISIENISKNDFDTLYKNDPEFKKLADKYYDSEEYNSRAAQAVAEKEAHLANAKKKDTLSKTDPRFANRTDTLSKSDSRFKVKKESDPANKYRIISKSKKYYEYGSDAKDAAEAHRVIEIAKRKRGIKDKDKLSSRAAAKYIKRTRHKYK